MKKIIAVLMVLLASNVYAADKVVVVPLGGDTYMVDPAKLVDAFVDFPNSPIASPTPEFVAYTVPEGKTFVLTDIFGHSNGSLTVKSGTTIKAIVNVGTSDETSSYGYAYDANISLGSGLTFLSGSQVILSDSGIRYSGSTTTYRGAMTISGYLY